MLNKIIDIDNFNAVVKAKYGYVLYNKNDTYVGSAIEKYGEFLESEVNVFKQLCQLGDTVVEVGANIGAHTQVLSQLVAEQGYIIAFESQRLIFQTLCANMALNSITNVDCYPFSVGSENNSKLVKLDDFLSLELLKLLKINADGMEYDVIAGAKKLINTHKPVLYVKNDQQDRSKSLIELIQSLDYRLFWHLPPLFNPHNYATCEENIYPNIFSINMLCFHKSCNLNITGLLEVTHSEDRPDKKIYSSANTSTQKSDQASVNLALTYHQAGQLEQAKAIYEKLLILEPENVIVIHYFGLIHHQQGNDETGIKLIEKALQLNPNYAEAYVNLGEIYRKQNAFDKAIELYNKALTINPNYADAHYNMGVVLQKKNQLNDAISCYQKALSLNPNYTDIYYNIGIVLEAQNKNDEAIVYYQKTLSLNPNYVEVYNRLGCVFQTQNKFNEAIDCYQNSLNLHPNNVDVNNNIGLALEEQNKIDEAIDYYQKNLILNPNHINTLYNIGNALRKKNKLDEALFNYQKVLSLDPNYVDIYNNIGVTLVNKNKINEAIIYYQKVISLNPDHKDAHVNLGNAFQKLNKFPEAIEYYKKSLEIEYSAKAFDNLFHCYQRCCDWREYNHSREKIIAAVNGNQEGYSPFVFLGLSESPSAQQQCASIFVAKNYPPSKKTLWINQRYQHDKIKIAYISADFRNHPISYLMVELFELHNKNRFETIAISLQAEDSSEIGQRIKCAFSQFIDVSSKSDEDIALLIRELEIDITVDLMGFTQHSKTGIFAYRPAPIQVSYLGYLGTMGADYIDYLLADVTLIPTEHQDYYSEKIVYLPHSFQVNDSTLAIADKVITRAEMGLPEQGFVFCCFNNNYKITPTVFDSWMRILHQVEDSVLWLLAGNRDAKTNLQLAATARGINPERICFANRLPISEYLTLHRLADLFLDTSPYNAGATASAALWAGLPVLTYLGNTFSGRMAASLLNAIGLPELITTSFQDYEALAVQLATHPEQLTALKQKLADNRLTYPLFNTVLFTQHLESAYVTMWEKYQRGEAAESFAVGAGA